MPEKQIFGFDLTTNEVMTRADFTDSLQKPLAEKLEAAGLWKFGEVTIPATNGQPEPPGSRVVQSKIRYAVLCYGVPLKIAPDPDLHEPVGARTTAAGIPPQRGRRGFGTGLAAADQR